MHELVFLEPNKIDEEPFTTSDVIAECADLNYRSVQRMIEKHQATIELYGKVRFQITPSGKTNQPKRVYHLNEQQATVLMTLLGNTPSVVAFKTELVRQFFAMRKELTNRHIERAQLKPVRREMTDVIQQVTDNKWAYKLYTDLAYKLVTGKISSKLRKERNAPKDAPAIDYMTADEIKNISKMQYGIAALLNIGMDYSTVKQTLQSSVSARCIA